LIKRVLGSKPEFSDIGDKIQAMAYSEDYFGLQLGFAKKVAEITGNNLEDVIPEYTTFFKTFRIEGWDISPNNPIWKKFLDEYRQSKDILNTIYNFYLEQIKIKGENNKKKLFGCFSYEYDEEKKSVSIHFRNVDTPEPGALSREKMGVRINELKEMFSDIKKVHPDTEEVTGSSWLYNIEAYKRLFPPGYMQNFRVVTDWFKSTAIWGQFLDSAGELKKDMILILSIFLMICLW